MFRRHTKIQVVQDLRTSCLARYGLEMSDKFIEDILTGNPELLEDCQSMHVDTSNREWFVGDVAQKVMRRRWPKGGDSDEFWEFFKEQLRTSLPVWGQRYVEIEDRPSWP